MPRIRQLPSAFHASLSALTAFSCSYTLSTLSEEAEKESNNEANAYKKDNHGNAEFFGFFPAREAATELKKSFPTIDEKDANNTLFSALKFNPSAEEKENLSPLFGEKAVAHVKAFVQDANAQAVRNAMNKYRLSLTCDRFS